MDVPINYTDNEGQWVHVAATYDGKAKKIYRDNVLIGTQNVTGTISTFGTAPATIGSFGGFAEFFNGSMDEFRLWDHAIDVKERVNCELEGPKTGLLDYYKFNQGIGAGANQKESIIIDYSGNSKYSYLMNFALSGLVSNWVAPGAIQNGFTCFD